MNYQLMNPISQTEAKQALRQTIRSAMSVLKPPPKLTITEWADQERRLSSEASAEPGRWYTSRANYQKGIILERINALFGEVWIKEIRFVISQQTDHMDYNSFKNC